MKIVGGPIHWYQLVLLLLTTLSLMTFVVVSFNLTPFLVKGSSTIADFILSPVPWQALALISLLGFSFSHYRWIQTVRQIDSLEKNLDKRCEWLEQQELRRQASNTLERVAGLRQELKRLDAPTYQPDGSVLIDLDNPPKISNAIRGAAGLPPNPRIPSED